jgi:hypothetical protein
MSWINTTLYNHKTYFFVDLISIIKEQESRRLTHEEMDNVSI